MTRVERSSHCASTSSRLACSDSTAGRQEQGSAQSGGVVQRARPWVRTRGARTAVGAVLLSDCLRIPLFALGQDLLAQLQIFLATALVLPAHVIDDVGLDEEKTELPPQAVTRKSKRRDTLQFHLGAIVVTYGANRTPNASSRQRQKIWMEAGTTCRTPAWARPRLARTRWLVRGGVAAFARVALVARLRESITHVLL